MNLLVVCEVNWVTKVVYDIHLLAEAMSLRGHKVCVLFYGQVPSDGESQKKFWLRRGMSRCILMKRALGHSLVELICPYTVGLPLMGRVSAFATHYFEIGRIIRERHIDAIVLYSVPTNGLQSVYWARKYNIPIVFRSIDVLNQLVPYPPLRYPTKVMEQLVYKKVDRVLTLTPKLSEYVIGLGVKAENVKVLPMTVDTDLFCPIKDTTDMRRRWGLGSTNKVVLFMGTLFRFSGLEGFIRQFAWRTADVKLMIVGDGAQRRYLESLVTESELEGRVIITGFQPYHDMPKYINMADVCINPFYSNGITKDIFPGKTVQFLACGKPLVMRPLAGVRSMIRGERQGVIYADTDLGIAESVAQVLSHPDVGRKIGENGLRYAKQNHGCHQVAKQLESELESLGCKN